MHKGVRVEISYGVICTSRIAYTTTIHLEK